MSKCTTDVNVYNCCQTVQLLSNCTTDVKVYNCCQNVKVIMELLDFAITLI